MLTRHRAVVARLTAFTLAVFATVGGTALTAVAAPAAASLTGTSLVSSLPVTADYATGYDRNLFQHWIDADGDGCDTRQEVLIAESQIPVTYTAGTCPVTAGQWYSPYDTVTWTNPSDVDIDHMVPLSEAWRSGAWAWTADQRKAFANDLDYNFTLIAVTDNVNQSKGDKDPAQWMPSNTAYRCDYVAQWIQVKYRWGLYVDSTEAAALNAVLQEPACAGMDVALPAQIVAPVTAPTVPTPTAAPSGQLVYRFYSPQNRAHFFTINLNERNSIITSYPASIWTYEGAAYEAYADPQTGTVPLYRFYSSTLRGHFFTTNQAERDFVIAAYDDSVWLYEGVAYNVFPSDANVTNTLDVARFWSPQNQHHFYTANATEAAGVRANYPANIWSYEGINFKVPASLATPPPPPAQYVPPVVVAPPAPSVPGNPGDAVNCTDFGTYAAAKAWFDRYRMYGDPARLDADNDGIPCESLPGAPR